jgi:hypothetical protein
LRPVQVGGFSAGAVDGDCSAGGMVVFGSPNVDGWVVRSETRLVGCGDAVAGVSTG